MQHERMGCKWRKGRIERMGSMKHISAAPVVCNFQPCSQAQLEYTAWTHSAASIGQAVWQKGGACV